MAMMMTPVAVLVMIVMMSHFYDNLGARFRNQWSKQSESKDSKRKLLHQT